MAGGRPTDYRKEHCATVIELGRQGKSKAQIAAELDVDRNTLDNWAEAHEEFFRALTRARDLSMAWWEGKAQDNLATSGFNANLWSRSMAARFPDDYTEKRKQEMTGKDGGPIEQNITAAVRPTITREEWVKLYVEAPAGSTASGD